MTDYGNIWREKRTSLNYTDVYKGMGEKDQIQVLGFEV